MVKVLKKDNKAHHQTSPPGLRPSVGIQVTYSSDYATTPVRKQNQTLYSEKRIHHGENTLVTLFN